MALTRPHRVWYLDCDREWQVEWRSMRSATDFYYDWLQPRRNGVLRPTESRHQHQETDPDSGEAETLGFHSFYI
jgi:hypothetical protein